MSRWRLLGVMRATDLPEALEGSGRTQAVERAAMGDLAVLGTPLGDVPPRRTRRQILGHLEILESLMPYGPLAPMRFGSICEGPQTAATALRPHRERLRRLLDGLAGRAEFMVRIAWPRDAVMAALAADHPELRRRGEALAARGPEAQAERIELGRAVAERLAARRRAAENRVLATARAVSDAVERSEPEGDLEILRAALLIAPESEAEIAAGMEAAARATGFGGDVAPEIKWIGPSPAFSFADAAFGAARGGDVAWAS